MMIDGKSMTLPCLPVLAALCFLFCIVPARGQSYCQSGLRHNAICCALECGSCGGLGCDHRPGGGASCCGGIIENAGRACENVDDVACVIETTTTTTSAPSSGPSSGPWPEFGQGYCDVRAPLEDIRVNVSLHDCYQHCLGIEDCAFAAYSSTDHQYSEDGTHCMLYSECPVFASYFAELWTTYRKLFSFAANVTCGNANSGECGGDNDLFIGSGGERFDNVSSRDTALADCASVCMASPDCGGFILVESQLRCYYRRSAVCGISAHDDRDCYTLLDHAIDTDDFNDDDDGGDYGNWHRPRGGVGGWGGICTCPDGQQYEVGDRNDACRSISCEGGTLGTCTRGGISSMYIGYGVTCAPHFICASEQDECSCIGQVHYGRRYLDGTAGSGALTSLEKMHETNYSTMNVSGNIHCNNTAFGGDPLDNHSKHCYCIPETRWCNEAMSGNGEDYRGCQHVTQSGIQCQSWTAQLPASHNRIPDNYPGAGLGSHSFCRNPDGESGIWCYQISGARWDYCSPLTLVYPTPEAEPNSNGANDAEDSFASSFASNGDSSDIQELPDGGVIIAIRATAADARANGGFLEFNVPGDSVAAASIPASVLEALGGDVILLLSEHGPGSLDSLAVTGQVLATAPISLTAYSSDGEVRREVQRLSEPIRLTLAPNRTGRCAFWDEARGSWSAAGMTQVDHSGPELICETTHLTIFAAIIGELLAIFECSNARVLSMETLERMTSDPFEWLTRPASLLIWAMLGISVIVMFVAKAKDRRMRARLGWDDDLFLTNHEAFDVDKHKKPETLFHKIVVARQFLAAPSEIGEYIAGECARQATASSRGICADDLKLLVTIHEVDHIAHKHAGCSQSVLSVHGKESTPSLQLQSNKRFRDVVVEQGAALSYETHKVIENFVVHWGGGRRIVMLFLALHPWLQLTRFHLEISGASRALLIIAHLFGAMAMSAMFFENTGKGTSVDSDAASCGTEGWRHALVRSVLVGFISTFVSILPVLVLKVSQRRRFQHSLDWDAKTQRRKRCCWLCGDIVLWIFGTSYILFCVVFLLAFVSSVNRDTELTFFTSATTSFVKEILISPFVTTTIYILIAMVYLLQRSREAGVSQLQKKLIVMTSVMKEAAEQNLEEDERCEVSELIREHDWSLQVLASGGAALLQMTAAGFHNARFTTAGWQNAHATLIDTIHKLAHIQAADVLCIDMSAHDSRGQVAANSLRGESLHNIVEVDQSGPVMFFTAILILPKGTDVEALGLKFDSQNAWSRLLAALSLNTAKAFAEVHLVSVTLQPVEVPTTASQVAQPLTVGDVPDCLKFVETLSEAVTLPDEVSLPAEMPTNPRSVLCAPGSMWEMCMCSGSNPKHDEAHQGLADER